MPSPTYKVSVIVPCYNVEQFLPRCLDSLVNQTLKDIEIICVNDASPDNSIAILRDYETRYDNIVVIDLQENVRQGGARNRGIEIARGEYITFVDSDDWVELDMMEKLYRKAVETGVDVVACGHDIIDQNDHIIEQKIADYAHICGHVTDNTRPDIILALSGPCWAKITKTTIFRQHKELRFPENMFYEDGIFTLKHGVLVNSYIYITECLYHYYTNTASTTKKRNSSSLYDRIKSLDLTMKYLSKISLKDNCREMLYIRSLHEYYVTAILYCMTFDHPTFSYIRFLRKRIKLLMPYIKTNSPYFHHLFNQHDRKYFTILRYSGILFYSVFRLKNGLRTLIHKPA